MHVASWQVAYRVLWPLLRPAIFASAVLVFSGVIDDFVIVDLLNATVTFLEKSRRAAILPARLSM